MTHCTLSWPAPSTPVPTLHLQCSNSHSLWTLPPGRGSTQGYIFSSRNGSLKSWQQMDKDLSIPSQDCFGLHLCCLRYDPSQSLNYLGAVPTSGVRMEPRYICFCSHYDFVLHKKKKRERENLFSAQNLYFTIWGIFRLNVNCRSAAGLGGFLLCLQITCLPCTSPVRCSQHIPVPNRNNNVYSYLVL